MFKILIVEDDTDKLRNIYRIVKEIDNVDLNNIEHVIDVIDAKQKTKLTSYDLMIVDIAIPPSKSESVDLEGGIKLVEEILLRDVYKIPTHIIGLTSKEEVFEKAFEKFESKALTVIRYSDTDMEWESKLSEGIAQRINSKVSFSQVAAEFNYDVAIITALAEPELKEVKRISSNWEKLNIPTDSTCYYATTLSKEDVKIKVVIAHAPQMGMCAASTLTMKIIENFRPQYLIMCGIAAGVKDGDNLKVGDILIADEVWDGASGKIKTTETDESLFLPDYRHKVLNEDMKDMLSNIKLERRYLDDIYKSYPTSNKPKLILDMHIGPMASVPAVIQNKNEIDKIKAHSRKLIGIEMESYGVFYSASNSSRPKPIVISIKSISDFADEHKSDNFQEYSAYTSAQFAYKIIMNDLVYITK